MSNQNHLQCEYCNKILSSLSSLNSHKKTARYCIKIQVDKKPELKTELKQYNLNCKYCDKNFKLKQSLERHEFTCNSIQVVLNENIKIKDTEILKLKEDNIKLKEDNKIFIIIKNKDNETISELKEKVNKLEDTIANIASQPNTITNNTNTLSKTTNNLQLNTLIMPDDKVKKAINDNYTKHLFLEGQKGVAEFFINFINKKEDGTGIIKISDPSRGMIKYLDEFGNTITDINGYKIIQKIQKPLLDKALIFLKEYTDEFYKLGLDPKVTDDESEIARIHSEMALDSKTSIKYMHEDSKEFTSELSKQLI